MLTPAPPPNTRTLVWVGRSMPSVVKAKTSKKGENFSAEEMDVLRDALRELWNTRKDPKESQKEFGVRLGISQQSVSRLLDVTDNSGTSFPTALAIARAFHCEDMKQFFEARGLRREEPQSPMHPNLARARRVATLLNPPIPDWIIDRVVEDAGGPFTVLRDKTWVSRFIDRYDGSLEPPPQAPPPAATEAPVSVHSARKRRTGNS